jgi:hypothetical protein
LPAGYVAPWAEPLLELYVGHLTNFRQLQGALATMKPGSKDHYNYTRLAASQAALVLSLATTLRLTPRSIKQGREPKRKSEGDI